MSTISLVTEPASIITCPDGPATGNVWLVLNGYEFPTHGWNDFIVVILGWWLTALLLLLRNDSRLERVHFMDGPYAVDVSMAPSGTLLFRALEGPDRTIEVANSEAPAMPFILELLTQSREVLAACRRQGWWSRDAEVLESALAALDQQSSKRSKGTVLPFA